jgi:prevent-host-death family protein
MGGLTPTLNQTRILVMSKTLSLTDVKARLSEVIDEVVATHERVTVTRNGRPVAVVISVDDLEAVEETAAILSDPAAMREIERGRAAIDAGDIVSKNDVTAMRDQLRARLM